MDKIVDEISRKSLAVNGCPTDSYAFFQLYPKITANTAAYVVSHSDATTLHTNDYWGDSAVHKYGGSFRKATTGAGFNDMQRCTHVRSLLARQHWQVGYIGKYRGPD